MNNCKAPAIFVGHGSPMNGIEDNHFSLKWQTIARTFPKPKGILAISAHWYTNGIRTNDALKPQMIYDMYGFPSALYEVKYDVQGLPDLAHRLKELIQREVIIDNSWGIDHGSWTVLRRMYPEADIPVVQLSIDGQRSSEEHYKIGQVLGQLRNEGIMILGSGNVVHNLARVNWEVEGGYPWAEAFDQYIKVAVETGEYEKVIQYKEAGEIARLSFTTPEHFYPLLYVLGASNKNDELSIFNEDCTLGSLSMTSYLFK